MLCIDQAVLFQPSARVVAISFSPLMKYQPSASQSMLGEGLHDTASKVPSEPSAGKGTDSTEKLLPFQLAANGMFVFALSA